ncbi:hypothetical protein [Stigmatella aurantiaca]|uniref:Uncharacterized protein n=1 Tax=Stigmatella aurantiaca (strain DW4/3-1) TaxID=378806 RepID=E3FZH7_STIAD|nr:hypothetical protein [Stigmatella aurantiaca]ADO68642.1 uncharacterized protein STAUR_0838 [Stigmatella aurantiaca DW4/3-1]
MAFRLQLAPQTVGLLSGCPSAVRERVLNELGEVFSGPLLRAGKPVSGAATGGDFTLPSGFHVRYALDRGHGLLHLLELRAPVEEATGAQAF